jgi:hypothetical protein
MNFAIGRYHYEIKTDAQQSVYSVTDGTRTLTAPLLWAFGNGRVGQSYLFKKVDGKFYEARVTYFETLDALHFTPARALDAPKDLEEAMYRPVDAAEIGRCFGCHNTASTIGEQFDEKNLILGVSCEACHGPGGKHVAAEQAALASSGQAGGEFIFNPARLIPVDSVDFCGACHGTWWDVKLSGAKGVGTAKSQPYRLAADLHGMSQSACSAANGAVGIRQGLFQLSRHSRREEDCESRCGCLSCGHEGLRFLPYADGLRARDAFQIHGPSDSSGAFGPSVSGMKVLVSVLIGLHQG